MSGAKSWDLKLRTVGPMLCEHHIRNTLSLQFAKIILLLADFKVERIKFQSASANLSRNYNAATMSKSFVFHCTWLD